MFTRRSMMAAAAISALVAAAPALGRDLDNLPRERVELVAPPFIHAHEQATKSGPKVIQFKMTIEEKELVIDNEGTKIHAMTFNGSVPGPMMVVHQDDYVELTLVNPETNEWPTTSTSTLQPARLGGGELTMVNPGEQVVLRFKATGPACSSITARPAGR